MVLGILCVIALVAERRSVAILAERASLGFRTTALFAAVVLAVGRHGGRFVRDARGFQPAFDSLDHLDGVALARRWLAGVAAVVVIPDGAPFVRLLLGVGLWRWSRRQLTSALQP